MQPSFFSIKETQSESRPDGKVYSCTSCGLYKNANHPKTEAIGNFKKKILIIGEAWGPIEDKSGEPWKSTPGTILRRALKDIDIDLFEDCLSIESVNCYPGKDKGPSTYEIDCCRSIMVTRTIKKYKPKVILLLGDSALYSFIGRRWQGTLGSIDKWRGFAIPDQDFNAWVIPTYHSSKMIEAGQDLQAIWERDISLIKEYLNKDFLKYTEPKIHTITDLAILNTIKSGNIAIDYETTGIKPHAPGHRIVSASVAIDENEAYTFLMPDTRVKRKPFTDLLTNPNIGKMAHNMKFEDNWTRVRLRVEVQNWNFDTMLMSHILDNRWGICGLKFQTYVRLGIVDYNSSVSPYLKSLEEKNGNSLNRIFDLIKTEEGLGQLLHYNALDTIYQYRLANIQKKLVGIFEDDLPF